MQPTAPEDTKLRTPIDHQTNPPGLPYGMARSDGDGMVPDKAGQEMEQAQQTLAQQEEPQLELAEGGRSHDTRKQGNPPGAVHGVPAPSLHGTWR